MCQEFLDAQVGVGAVYFKFLRSTCRNNKQHQQSVKWGITQLSSHSGPIFSSGLRHYYSHSGTILCQAYFLELKGGTCRPQQHVICIQQKETLNTLYLYLVILCFLISIQTEYKLTWSQKDYNQDQSIILFIYLFEKRPDQTGQLIHSHHAHHQQNPTSS